MIYLPFLLKYFVKCLRDITLTSGLTELKLFSPVCQNLTSADCIALGVLVLDRAVYKLTVKNICQIFRNKEILQYFITIYNENNLHIFLSFFQFFKNLYSRIQLKDKVFNFLRD